MNSEDQKLFIENVSENSENILSSLGKMEGMIQGKPPMGGGRPPGGGKPPAGGNGQNAVKAYGISENETSDEESQLELIETLIEALESDEEDEEGVTSNFFQSISSQIVSSND